ncbi:hypothetical protein KUCAC02_008380 [Chaenocephalus aceratus]|uniref:Uncharacterized protein n=1 Tax=Chaenocephalus aceratus TaxID=36190 RepID=A0ACB9X931_CHAAC|nr:hypothetical protein KUCAC02_008380 [Chaenocephalus aceratus]
MTVSCVELAEGGLGGTAVLTGQHFGTSEPCVAVELRDEGVVENEDGGWQSERAAEGTERWQGEPQNQLEASEWTLPGGPGGEVTEGGVVVSCQLLACKQSGKRVFCMKKEF